MIPIKKYIIYITASFRKSEINFFLKFYFYLTEH